MTNDELSREIVRLVKTVIDQLDNTRGENERVGAALAKVTDVLTALLTRVAVLEQQVGDLRGASEEKGRRWWSFLSALVGAVIGGILTVLGQLLLEYWKK